MCDKLKALPSGLPSFPNQLGPPLPWKATDFRRMPWFFGNLLLITSREEGYLK